MVRFKDIFFMAWVFSGSIVSGLTGQVPMGVRALTDLAGLPLLRSGTWLVGTDSHDVTGGNDDGFRATYSYLYKDGNEYVLFDHEGPGCIYELRTIRFEGNLNIYLDGAERPQLVIPFKELYSGKQPPFISPFVADEQVAHGSCWSYVPICYTTGCKLTTDTIRKCKFLNIFAHQYARGTQPPPFDPKASLDAATQLWSEPDKAPVIGPHSKEIHNNTTISPRKSIIMADIRGSGAIQRIRLRFPQGSTDLSGSLVLRAYWDEQKVPQVNSPVSTFFALGCPRAIRAKRFAVRTKDEGKKYTTGAIPPQSLVVGQSKDGWLYCHFPMPYWKSARIDMFNESDHESIGVEYAIDYSEKAYPASAGYFHAQWHQESPLRPGEDFCVLDTRGWGHYVGCVLTFSTVHGRDPDNTSFARNHLEGDARFYIDDIRTPFVACTGTEEYFNWGWWNALQHDTPFSYPTHGYPLHLIDNQDHAVMYRFHISELVPYYRSFKFDFEHGPIGRDTAHYSGTAFFYQRPTCGLILTDELDVCDAQSEAGHQYSCQGIVRQSQQMLPYEGSYQRPLTDDAPRDRCHVVKDNGRVWDQFCAFTVKILPDNAGIKLRRRSDYAFGAQGDLSDQRSKAVFTAPQRVEVQVDGKAVGDWYLPSRHARATWLDSDFEIPAEFTRNKEQIRITMTGKDGTRWDEYTYWIYTYRNTVEQP